MKRIDLKGRRFERLVVLSYCGNRKWNCICDCGNQTTAYGYDLTGGKVKSCGCYRKETASETWKNHFSTHGMSDTRIYNIWSGMKSRCNYPRNVEYQNYGGRGICVCQEWDSSFESFYKWAAENGYSDDLTIERIDNDRGYSPDNCRWATYKEQANNRRGLRKITYKGETKTISDWAREYGMSHETLRYRLDVSGWDIEKALTTEVKKYAKPDRCAR